MITVSITRILVKRELVLPQNAEFLRPRDVALGRVDFAGQDLHQRGLAGAIRPGNAVAPAVEESGGDLFEQDSGAEAHGDVVNGKQGVAIVARLRFACRVCGVPAAGQVSITLPEFRLSLLTIPLEPN